MNTLHLQNNFKDLNIAADIIRSGGLVAFPTETVYGLGADARIEQSVKNIYLAKGRPSDNPLIVHVAEWEDVYKFCKDIPPIAKALADAFWPGPLTMLLPKNDVIPAVTTAGLPTVAVRCPDNQIAHDLIKYSGCPIAAPSANLSGKPSPTAYEHIVHDLEGRVDALINGGACSVGVESTILDVTVTPPCLLRPGEITVPMIESVIGKIDIDPSLMHLLPKEVKPKAPGMKYRHYAPSAPVVILRGNIADVCTYLERQNKLQTNFKILCYDEEVEQLSAYPHLAYGSKNEPLSLSQHLFSALRELDSEKLDIIFARCPEGSFDTLAVENRLKKAAGFQILSLSNPRRIGLTGSSGSGKTSLSNFLRNKGVPVIDADKLYHQMLQDDMALLNEIRVSFPDCFIDEKFHREILSKIVFADKEKLQHLNEITLRNVISKIRSVIDTEFSHEECVIIDAPTLFESKYDQECTLIVSVLASDEIRLQRICLRDGITRDAALSRISNQHDNAFFEQHSNISLTNDTSIEAFNLKAEEFYQNIIKEKYSDKE